VSATYTERFPSRDTLPADPFESVLISPIDATIKVSLEGRWVLSSYIRRYHSVTMSTTVRSQF
jgi:hypothetical protein